MHVYNLKFSEKYLLCGASTQAFHICSLQDLSAETRSNSPSLSVCAPTPTRRAAPWAIPGAHQDPDAKLGKALAATSGCVAMSKGSCANRSGIASGSGLTRALLGDIFLLLTFVRCVGFSFITQ